MFWLHADSQQDHTNLTPRDRAKVASRERERERKRGDYMSGLLPSILYPSQRVHVGIWYILRAQRGSHITTLRPKYIPYSYMDPLGLRAPKDFEYALFNVQPRAMSWNSINTASDTECIVMPQVYNLGTAPTQ